MLSSISSIVDFTCGFFAKYTLSVAAVPARHHRDPATAQRIVHASAYLGLLRVEVYVSGHHAEDIQKDPLVSFVAGHA